MNAFPSMESRRKRPYDEYNLFFILEQERLLQRYQRSASSSSSSTTAPSSSSSSNVVLPPLPPRYRHLELSNDWFLSSDNYRPKSWNRASASFSIANASSGSAVSVGTKKTKQMSFLEVTRTVALNWATLDATTKNYVSAVSRMLSSGSQDKDEESSLQDILFLFQDLADGTNGRRITTPPSPSSLPKSLFNNLCIPCKPLDRISMRAVSYNNKRLRHGDLKNLALLSRDMM